MKKHLQKITLLILSGIIFSLLSVIPVPASEVPESAAVNLTPASVISVEAGQSAQKLYDGNNLSYCQVSPGKQISVTATQDIAGIYIKFYHTPAPYTVSSDTSNAMPIDKIGEFIQDYTGIENCRFGKEILLTFSEGAQIAELEIYSKGTLPESVHIWESCHEQADLLVFSTHADDDQLFLGPAIISAIAKGAAVQVCYIVDHGKSGGYYNPSRGHELLEGLWTIGMRNYPVMGRFHDLFSLTYEEAITQYKEHGTTLSDIVGYEVECIRRFHPQVVITHSLTGEYGHGQHRVTSKALTLAVSYAESAKDFPATYQKYGVWSVKKTYLHQYAQNEIRLDIDTPLEMYGGKTAFLMSQEGFLCHKSQQPYWTTEWLMGTADAPITNSTTIQYFNPAHFGLYRSTVGADTGNDMFENITFYPTAQPDPPADTTVETTEEITEPVTTAPEETTGSPETTLPDETSSVSEITTAVPDTSSDVTGSGSADTENSPDESSEPVEVSSSSDGTTSDTGKQTTGCKLISLCPAAVAITVISFICIRKKDESN